MPQRTQQRAFKISFYPDWQTDLTKLVPRFSLGREPWERGWNGWDSTRVKLCLGEQARRVANPMIIAFAFAKLRSLDFFLSILAWIFRRNTSLSLEITYDFQVQVQEHRIEEHTVKFRK